MEDRRRTDSTMVRWPSRSATGGRPRREPTGGRLYLLVIGDDLYATHPLPDSGSVVIGRSPSCEVFIDHASVSRRHAVLHVRPLWISDAGSSNGTRVREKWVAAEEQVEVVPGEIVEVGSVQLIVQQRSAPLSRRRLWSHDYFDARLAEECERCSAIGVACAVIHVRTTRATPNDVVEDALASELRIFDTVGSYAPGQYEILLANVAEGAAAAVAQRVRQRLADHKVEAKIGIASYPDDGRDADSLIARAVHATRGEQQRPSPPALTTVSESPMQVLRRLVDRIAQGNISVLILGETGVGKEVMAETVHRMSRRATKGFLGLNCAALTETLLESELFGHERGAFTGATQSKPGLLETAEGGTVFLDEIGELPASTQVKLLRVLEQRTVLRVGGLKPRPIDVRFVAATNRDLEAEVAAGTFRQDLYFRLNGISLTIPPLRERVPEINELAGIFIAQSCREAGMPTLGLAPEALDLMERYSWPGNIRELRNVIERAVLLSTGDSITLEHLPVEKMLGAQTKVQRFGEPTSIQPPAAMSSSHAPTDGRPERRTPRTPKLAEESLDFRKEQRDAERRRIISALRECAGNQSKAAQMLGISRRTLLTKLDLHGLPRPRKGK